MKTITLFLFLCCSFTFSTANAQPCLESDSLVLVEFYNATGGPNWTDTWNLNAPVSTWYGVRLDWAGCAVTCLDLDGNPDCAYSEDGGNNLVGSLVDLNLPDLQSLFLAQNQLGGNIPDFTNSPNLRNLCLTMNQLTGGIPDFDLPNLNVLYLFENLFSGNIPNFDLPSLTALDLSGNLINGNIPSFNKLTKLQSLGLSGTQVSGNIPNFNLPALVDLEMVDNQQLNGSIPNLNLPNLVALFLNDNQLSGSIPDFNLPKLRRLRLFSNQLVGSIPDFSLPNLESLKLYNNRLSSSAPNFNLPNLSDLFLWNNQFNFNSLLIYLDGNSTIPNYSYAPQDSIAPLRLAPETLCVIVGGNTSDNTYTWYKNGIPLTSVVGDSSFFITGAGQYRCEVKNSFLPDLTLHSKVLNVCSASLGVAESLFAFPTSAVVCPNESLTFFVPENYTRYIFSRNGIIVQDSTINTFEADYLQNGDLFSCMVYDANGCNYLTSSKIINAYEVLEISTCNPTADSLQISLSQGTPPWSFDLSSINDQGTLASVSYTINSSLDTILTKKNNTYYEIQNVTLDNTPCTYSISHPTGHIEGCASVCVGYAPDYDESYTAYFPNTIDSIQWSVLPQDAIANGDIAFLDGQNTPIVELDFSNASPIHETITLIATATTDCGTEILSYEIKLDNACVWPGDVNRDGQVKDNTGSDWIDDNVALEFAREDYFSLVNNNNGDVFHKYNRDPGCLADSMHQWYPQSGRDWQMERPDGSFYLANFELEIDSNGTLGSLNLKYADCNGSGAIETYQNWYQSSNVPFTSVPNPTDRDMITYHAENQSQNQGNMPLAKTQNNFAQSLHIVSPDTITNGDQVVFTVYLGAVDDTVRNVHHLSFVGEGEFGDYYQPAISIMNSHLSGGSSAYLADYPFLHPDFDGNENDSLRWYISLSRPPNLSYSIDFAGEEVCQLECHIIVANFDDPQTPTSKTTSNAPLPVTFKIPAAGVLHGDGSVTYVQAQEATIWVRPNPILNARVLLEGSYEPAKGLMRNDLCTNGLLPAHEPYADLGYPFPHSEMQDLQIPDSLLLVTGQEAIVDWIFIEIRDADDPSLLIAARPALLTREGMVVGMDGKTGPRLSQVPQGEYYVLIRHRNHLPVCTSKPVLLDDDAALVDFAAMTSHDGMKEIAPGSMGLFVGDMNGDYGIDGIDNVLFIEQNGTFDGYLPTDLDFNTDVNSHDKGLWSENNGRFFLAPW